MTTINNKEIYIFDGESLHILLEHYKHDILEVLQIGPEYSQEDEQKINSINEITVDIEKYKKKHRTKNTIQSEHRCVAKRADGQQCSRKRKPDSRYCGTHIKGCPHGEINQTHDKQESTITTEAICYNGIYYYVDKQNNVYNTEEVYKNEVNPKIIGKWDDDKIIFNTSIES